jgi:hypothetical protein
MAARHPHEPRRSRPFPSFPRPMTDAAERPDRADRTARDGSVHWVRVTCPDCGVVRVGTDRVVIRNCVDNQTWSYRARCSQCGTVFLGDTPEALAIAAIGAGVSVETWTLPVASARRPGPPLRAADVVELHVALLADDWFERLAQVQPPLGDR